MAPKPRPKNASNATEPKPAVYVRERDDAEFEKAKLVQRRLGNDYVLYERRAAPGGGVDCGPEVDRNPRPVRGVDNL